eukprot:6489893-Pyramimonas_sp.AAC.2
MFITHLDRVRQPTVDSRRLPCRAVLGFLRTSSCTACPLCEAARKGPHGRRAARSADVAMCFRANALPSLP